MKFSAVHETFRLLPADSVADRCSPSIFGRKWKHPPLAAHLRWAESMVADLEKTMAANAWMLARAGHLNRKDSPGIKHAETLVTRPKPESVRQQTDDDRLGLGSYGMKAAVLEHFRRNSDTDTQYRLALRRQQLMREQDAAARKAEAASKQEPS